LLAGWRVLLFFAGGGLGCDDASGQVIGGRSLFDAGAAPTAASDAALPASCEPGGTNSGSGWGDLFACYFGPIGIATCINAACHAENGAGSAFWSCSGSTADCYQGIQTVIGGIKDPNSTVLYPQLRRPDGLGTMPLPISPATTFYTFTDADLTRIATWIRNGAPDD
jgi:hypothetical protein